MFCNDNDFFRPLSDQQWDAMKKYWTRTLGADHPIFGSEKVTVFFERRGKTTICVLKYLNFVDSITEEFCIGATTLVKGDTFDPQRGEWEAFRKALKDLVYHQLKSRGLSVADLVPRKYGIHYCGVSVTT